LNYKGPRKRRQRRRPKKGYEKIFEEIIVANFPNMEKEIGNQVQEALRVPYRINSRRNTPRHILIKLTKTKYKERILKHHPAMQEIQVRSLGREDPLRRKWQPTSVILPGKFHEQRSLVGYSPWG